MRINGSSHGALPGKFRLSGSGNYKIEITAPGYKTYRVSKEIELGGEYEVEARLEKEHLVAASSEKAFTNSLGMKFVPIPAGSFMMGSPKDEPGRSDDETQHKVTLTKGFHMQTTEVTQGQWKAVMGNNPSSFKDCGDNCPVESVSWNDIQEFIKKLNQKGEGTYRLPSEAEWEYAARAGSKTAFHNGDITEKECGNDPNLSKAGWYCGNAGSKTHGVGQKQANAWGLYDMHGNVWEWCQDWHGTYPSGAVTDPTGSDTGVGRVLRGGGWYDDVRRCRAADRRVYFPDDGFSLCGFRLVRP